MSKIFEISNYDENIIKCENIFKNKKGRKKLKEAYNEKFLVKKVKTRCFKIFFKLLSKCIDLNVSKSEWKVDEKKEIFKLFKSDV